MEAEEYLDLVDEHDQVIGKKLRSDLAAGDIVRSVALIIKNSNSEILVATRGPGKNSAGMLCPPAMGAVSSGETAHNTIIRETQEELGIIISHDNLDQELKLNVPPTHGDWRAFMSFFVMTRDEPIDSYQPDSQEIAELNWYTLDALLVLHQEEPKQFMNAWRYWINHHHTDA